MRTCFSLKQWTKPTIDSAKPRCLYFPLMPTVCCNSQIRVFLTHSTQRYFNMFFKIKQIAHQQRYFLFFLYEKLPLVEFFGEAGFRSVVISHWQKNMGQLWILMFQSIPFLPKSTSHPILVSFFPISVCLHFPPVSNYFLKSSCLCISIYFWIFMSIRKQFAYIIEDQNSD